MAIKLTFGKVVEGDTVYRPPAVITLAEKEEAEIVAKGNAEYVKEHDNHDNHKKVKKDVQRSDSE